MRDRRLEMYSRRTGKTLTALMESLIQEGARELRYVRGKLKERAGSAKGLSGRTLVEWHKAEAMAMSRARAITALEGNKGPARSYEELLRELRSE